MLTLLFYISVVFLVVALPIAWLGLGIWRRKLSERQEQKARSQFDRHRAELENDFFTAAAASGKPRGLRWVDCNFHEGWLLARDIASSELHALAGVTVRFEAIEGGDMEEVEAVSNLRCATAVFTYNKKHWITAGRVVFNLEPLETIEHYKDSLLAVSTNRVPSAE